MTDSDPVRQPDPADGSGASGAAPTPLSAGTAATPVSDSAMASSATATGTTASGFDGPTMASLADPGSPTALEALAPPPAVPLPPPPHRDDGGRLGGVIPLLLAALGLAAALIAWRAGVAASAADDASRAGIEAGRERAATIIKNAGITARATEAYLDYERARRRAEALAGGGSNGEALLNRMEATSHWFLVPPEYLDRNGQFQPAQEEAALLTDAEANHDIQPQPHFSEADSEYDRIRALIGAGIAVALALPFLTIAELARGRLRRTGVLAGLALFGVGLLLAGMAWL